MTRFCGLTGPEQHLLVFLVLSAEWRDAEWSGTYGDISDATRIGRHQVPKLVQGLLRRGLVDEVESFGRGRCGRLFVACYDLLVVNKTTSNQISRRRALDPDWTSFGLGLDSGRPMRPKPPALTCPIAKP